jgi:SAM-dependent methyltransferase
MVRAATLKAAQRGCAGRTEFLCAPAEGLGEVVGAARFDAVISNFGALNCVADLPGLARELAVRVRPGGRLVWVLMGRHVPWEWGWYLLRADLRRARRRLSGRTSWRGLEIHYPTPATVRSALHPAFRVDALRPLGFALPPSYAAAWLNRHPRLLAALARVESLGDSSALLARCADHYIVEATRLPGSAA